MIEYQKDGRAEVVCAGSWDQQEALEFQLLMGFFESFNEQGLPVPAELRPWLEADGWWRMKRGAISALRTVSAGPTEGWPPEGVLPTLGLCQHYGLQTRLLDWSLDPMVAAYFAVIENAERIFQKEPVSRWTAIWALNRHYVHLKWPSDRWREASVFLVYPPRIENPNLHAQAGVFTMDMAQRTSGTPATAEPLDLTMKRTMDAQVAQELRKICGRDVPVLVKIMFPSSLACELLRRLAERRVSAATIYPGYGGAARAVRETLYWDRVPLARQIF